ncbi:MAG: DUF2634 domain-containing protein [Clostridia bacterium]|nr:DUF2634 domain-containing protein [Clostridia bacterium]
MDERSFLPQSDDLTAVRQISSQPGYTYKADIESHRIRGYVDGVDALRQTIFHILSVQRYRYPIYSFNYGVELEDLVGMPPDYVMSVIKQRISDALLQDDRIEYIDEWDFIRRGNSITVTFTVHSIYGDMTVSREVQNIV